MRLLYLLLLGISALPIGAAEADSPPRVEDLIRAGRQTVKTFQTTPAAWRVRFRMPNGFTMETKVVRDEKRQAWRFAQIVDGRTELLSEVIERDGVWHVIESKRRAKYRPYEAELHLPGGYLLLALAQLRCVQDKGEFDNAKFEERRGHIVSYRLPIPPETRALLKKSVAALEQLQKQDPTLATRPDTIKLLELTREQLAKGTPLVVDEATGIMVECKLRDMLISLEDFKWLNTTVDADFALPRNAVWDDQARPWSDTELNDCVMVGHDPLFQAGGKNPAIDAYLLNVQSGRLRRLPYEGISSMPGCFLKDRREVIVCGFDVDGPAGLVKVNLQTRANTPVESDHGKGRMSMFAELSPDGEKAATLQMSASGQMTDFQFRVVNLADGTSRLLGSPKRIGGPFSWLPAGDGLILKRFEPVEDPRAIEPRMLCRMDLNGKLTDLRRGDWPMVLRSTRKILYKDDELELWHTCDLDGFNPRIFADGLARHSTPTVSPDESRIIFTHYEKGKLPELLLFELGKPKGKPVVRASGFTGTPIWR